MFSHVMVGADDIEASKKFYDSVLGTLGVAPGEADPKGRVWYSSPNGLFAISKPLNGQPATGANGGTVGFRASSAQQAEDWHAAGVANGGTTCEDPPGMRPSGLYLAYLKDPAGNKLCVLYEAAG
jgi:catechol 2,3-dioxygenase-like lactoylglutathione lyase family enzyme